MFLGLPTFYNTGTAAITTGTKVITFQGAALGTLDFPAVLPGDLFMNPAEPETPPQRIESIDYAADPQTATLAFNWPGATMVDIAYEIRLVGNIERSTAQTRRYLELLGQLGYTGIAVNAFGEFADRSLYDDMVQGYTYLSFDGDGTPGSPPYLYVKKSSASADWSDPIAFVGAEGPPGPTGQAAAWRSGTGVPSGGLGNDGDMYIDLATADVYGPKTAGAWGAIAINIKGEQGNPGIDGIDGTSMLSRVRVVSEINVDISNLNNGDTIDGVVVATNWLVLLAGQTDATENGVYVIGATAGTTVRAAAFDTFDELPGTYFSVMQGTANADTLWKCSSDLGGTIGVDDLIFEMFASSEGFMSRTYESYALNSGVTYTLPSTPASDNALDVYVGGILQPKGGVAYTFSGTTLTLSEDPGATDLVEVYIFEALAMGAVPPSSVGSAEINAAQAAAIRVVLGILGTPREVLTAARTYYVRTDGSDAHDGLTDTVGGAFLTPQKALDVIATLDLAGFDATISIGAGTFNDLAINKPIVGGSLFITGAGATTIMSASALSAAILVNSAQAALITISSLKFATAGGSRAGVRVDAAAKVILGTGIEFGACSNSHMLVAAPGGFIHAQQAYTISGGATSHMNCQFQGFIRNDNKTVTLTGTPAFTTAFAYASNGGGMLTGNTWTGSATGKRFEAFTGGFINIQGLGLENLPGSTAGTVASGGSYDNLVGGGREVLTANRTYYVRTDGSNSNTGLANTAGGAFLTLQKAWDAVAALDLSIYSITIQVGDGTYTAGINLAAMPVGGSGIFITGNTTTPANVHLNCTTTCFEISAPLPCAMTIDGFKCTFTGGSLSAVYIRAAGVLTILKMEVAGGSTGFAGAFRANGSGAKLQIFGAQTVTGGMSCYVQALGGGHIQFSATTVTLTGTPAFSWLTVNADSFGYVTVGGVTFSGAASGTRYGAGLNGGINTGGGGASFIPGSVAGSVATSGWYV